MVADNLGRPGMSAWRNAVTLLREEGGLFLLGACRAEDFHPSLVRGSARIVEPQLDESTARSIASRVEGSGLTLQMAPGEALERADGLLMEFLAMLTTGRRLEQVLAEQATDLREPGRELQRDAARLLTAAHSVGLSLNAERLGEVLRGDAAPETVGDALDVLRNEHIVTPDGHSWRGLHELRSQTLTRLLHESPPPTLTSTWARVAELLSPREAGWLLRRVAEQAPQSLTSIAGAVGTLLSSQLIAADEIAQLLEGAERADNAIYARACVPIFEAHLRAGVTLHQLGLFAYSVRNQGTVFERTGFPDLDRMYRRVEQVAMQLPQRSADAASIVARSLDEARIRAVLSGASLVEAVRLLEAGAGLFALTPELARQTLDQFPKPADLESAGLWSRLIEAIAGSVDADDRSVILGTLEERLRTVATADPRVVCFELDMSDMTASVTIMSPLSPAEDKSPPWDVVPRLGSDLINGTAVGAARRIVAACPEVTRVEVITITASGKRLRVADHEPGYKLMSRDAFPDRVGVRRSVGFQAAVRRLSASVSWTNLIKDQIEIATELTELTDQALARLNPSDNARRRRDWTTRLDAVRARTASLATRPASTGVNLDAPHAQADDSERQADAASETLNAVAQALPQVLSPAHPVGLGMNFRDLADRLRTAAADSNPTIGDLGQPIPDSFIVALERVAAVLVISNSDAMVVRRLRGLDLARSADEILARASATAEERQREILGPALRQVPDAQLRRVRDPQPAPGAIDDYACFLVAPLESWPDLVEALRQLPQDARQEIGSRVVAAAINDGHVLPLAVQLTMYGDRADLPMTADMIRPFALEAGLDVQRGVSVDSVSGILNDLLGLSWQHALARRRPSEWPTPPSYVGPTLDDLRQRIAAITASLPSVWAAVAHEATETLLRHVAAEIEGQEVVPLAGEVADSQGLGVPPETQVPHLWEALNGLLGVTLLGHEEA